MIDPMLQGHFREFGFIMDLITQDSFVAIFTLSALVSFVIPLPEVVLLLLIGFLAKAAGLGLPAAVFVSIVGTIVGDNVLYRLSFFGNKHVERFNRKMRASKLIQYEHLVSDNIGKTIYFLRFVTGVRFFGPVIAGTLGVRWRTFFFYNSTATTVHSLFFILLGFYSQQKIIGLIVGVEVVRNVLLFSSVLIVGVLLRIFSKKQE